MRAANPSLRLMDGFQLTLDGSPVEVPLTSQRLVAMLAIGGRTVHRSVVGGTLWPDSSEARAFGNLRSALWRMQRTAPDMIRSVGSGLSLSERIAVDTTEMVAHARRLLDGRPSAADLDVDPTRLTGELLPDWDEEWLEGHRERMRLLGIHALEALSCHLRALRRYAEAVDAAQLAVMREPLRETARRALIEAHLAEGNRHEALRQLTAFRRTLSRELGIEPSGPLVALLVGSAPPSDGSLRPALSLIGGGS